MKQGGFKALCLVLVVCVLLPAVVGADEKAVNLESRVIENFDGSSGYEWRVMASKFATKTDKETFPKIGLIKAWPAAVYGYNKEGKDIRSLGIWGRFDRKGYNWIDVYPVKKGSSDNAPAEIPMPGRVQMLDMWVWGSNFYYYLEAYVRDYKGIVHIIPMGDLNFEGWKNLRIAIPANIPQAKRTFPKRQGLSLVKFRIWTRPTERVDDFQIYFNQVKVLTDTFESLFDGDDLADPENVQQLWNASATTNAR
ncbi:MAG: flagellar filament outer layer protein FlaA [Treponemataceae bacterium]|nr:flagellar filament outer layer protein FlaA [Treponemataceae bacterium]